MFIYIKMGTSIKESGNKALSMVKVIIFIKRRKKNMKVTGRMAICTEEGPFITKME